MDKLISGIKTALKTCLNVELNESVLVITDKENLRIGSFFEKEAKKIAKKSSLFVMEDCGERPLVMSNEILDFIRQFDIVILCATSKTGELESFRRPIYSLVGKSEMRLASMVGTNEGVISSGLNVNYSKVKLMTSNVFELLDKCKKMVVKTELGTNLEIEFEDNNWIICNGHITKGEWSNLPDGEVFTFPHKIKGTVVIDGVIGGVFDKKYGLLNKTPLSVEIKDNLAQIHSIKCENSELVNEFIQVLSTDENSAKVGEVALGTNLFLKKLIGNITHDEKYPSFHLAFGDPYGDLTGAKWKSKTHYDGVVLDTTIEVDGKIIMNKGKYLNSILHNIEL